MQYGEPNLNEGKPWSEMDLFDLKDCIARDTPVAEIATSCAAARKRCARRSPTFRKQGAFR
jgi:hypothetical protein